MKGLNNFKKLSDQPVVELKQQLEQERRKVAQSKKLASLNIFPMQALLKFQEKK